MLKKDRLASGILGSLVRGACSLGDRAGAFCRGSSLRGDAVSRRVDSQAMSAVGRSGLFKYCVSRSCSVGHTSEGMLMRGDC